MFAPVHVRACAALEHAALVTTPRTAATLRHRPEIYINNHESLRASIPDSISPHPVLEACLLAATVVKDLLAHRGAYSDLFASLGGI